LSEDGMLSFTPAADMSGRCTCNVTLAEEGTGGLATSRTLVILVAAGESAKMRQMQDSERCT
jgi:hypothetical protein